MSAVPGGEVAATLQRLINEIDIIKSSQSQQGIDLAAANVELNSLRLGLPQASQHVFDEVKKDTALSILENQRQVGEFIATKSAELETKVGNFMQNSKAEIDVAMQQLGTAANKHEAEIADIPKVSTDEFTKQASTISTHGIQLRSHHDTLIDLKGNIVRAEADQRYRPAGQHRLCRIPGGH
jgi:hypothetical protein